MAPFDYAGDAVYKLPEMWAAQTEAMKKINNSGLVIVNDIGDIANIHPRKKAEVGKRLADLARFDTYGQKDLLACGPVFRGEKSEDGAIQITFDYAGEGLAVRGGGSLTCFEIAGSDRKYVSAKAEIEGNNIIVVSALGVKQPKYVRFGWHETALPNLINSKGLPAGAFEIVSN